MIAFPPKRTKTIAFTAAEILESRLSLIEMCRLQGFPTRYNITKKQLEPDWSKVRQVLTWMDHEHNITYYKWEEKWN